MSADAVVFGDVSSFVAIESPTVQNDDTVQDECESGRQSIALEITLANVQSLHGEVSDTISFRVGTEQLSIWMAYPRLDDSGNLTWRGTGAIAAGQRLGAALHFSDRDQLWSLMGEHLFTLDDLGGLAFQPGSESCVVKSPRSSLNGLILSEVETLLSACQPSAEADRRRDLIELSWGTDPAWYMVGYCWSDDSLAPGMCRADADCPPTTLCVDGECKAP